MTVIRTDTGLWKKLSRGAFGGKVLVGIQEGAGSEDETTLAQIAQWLHDGTSTIPPRPFLSTTLDGRLSYVRQMVGRLVKAVLDGKLEPEQALQILGQWGRDRVVGAIDQGFPPENDEETKRRKGSDKPLIDTGQLKSTISWVVEMDGPGGGDE